MKGLIREMMLVIYNPELSYLINHML